MNQGPGLCRSRKSRWGRCGTKGRAGGPVGRWKSRVLGLRRGEWLGRGRMMEGGRKSRTGQDGQDGGGWAGRGGDGVKRARADSGTSGSEGREAAAALTKKERPQSGGSADGAGVWRATGGEVGTIERAPAAPGSANAPGRRPPQPGARPGGTENDPHSEGASRPLACVLVRLLLRRLSYYDLRDAPTYIVRIHKNSLASRGSTSFFLW